MQDDYIDSQFPKIKTTLLPLIVVLKKFYTVAEVEQSYRNILVQKLLKFKRELIESDSNQVDKANLNKESQSMLQTHTAFGEIREMQRPQS